MARQFVEILDSFLDAGFVECDEDAAGLVDDRKSGRIINGAQVAGYGTSPSDRSARGRVPLIV
jgi:hypothetical protein